MHRDPTERSQWRARLYVVPLLNSVVGLGVHSGPRLRLLAWDIQSLTAFPQTFTADA